MTSDSQLAELSIDLREHGICWVVPEGASISGATVELPGGALILGSFKGSIICKEGSLIVAKQAEFSGHGIADKVYIEGGILPLSDGTNSVLQGKKFLAVSSLAKGRADLLSAAFSIHAVEATRFAGRFAPNPKPGIKKKTV